MQLHVLHPPRVNPDRVSSSGELCPSHRGRAQEHMVSTRLNPCRGMILSF